VSTDKIGTEISSPLTGVLQQISVEENDVVAVGAELAIIVNASTEPVSPAPVAPAAPLPPSPPEPAPEPATVATSAPPQQPTQSGIVVEKLPRIRRTIARRMVESRQVAAQLTSVVEVDVTAIQPILLDSKRRRRETWGGSL